MLCSGGTHPACHRSALPLSCQNEITYLGSAGPRVSTHHTFWHSSTASRRQLTFIAPLRYVGDAPAVMAAEEQYFCIPSFFLYTIFILSYTSAGCALSYACAFRFSVALSSGGAAAPQKTSTDRIKGHRNAKLRRNSATDVVGLNDLGIGKLCCETLHNLIALTRPEMA